jgi:hypothetical protein
MSPMPQRQLVGAVCLLFLAFFIALTQDDWPQSTPISFDIFVPTAIIFSLWFICSLVTKVKMVLNRPAMLVSFLSVMLSVFFFIVMYFSGACPYFQTNSHSLFQAGLWVTTIAWMMVDLCEWLLIVLYGRVNNLSHKRKRIDA